MDQAGRNVGVAQAVLDQHPATGPTPGLWRGFLISVMVNDHTAFRVDAMPFAGLRESVLGAGGSPYTIEDMQIDKMLVVKSVEL